MRLAHIILAHRLPEQTARLAARVAAPGDQVLVHVDARVPVDAFAAALDGLSPDVDVRLLPQVVCAWGGFGLVRATLAGIAAAVRSDPAPDHVLLLSGQDYPIKPRYELEARLMARAGHGFLRHFSLPAAGLVDGGGMDRLERYYLRPSRRWSLPNRFTPLIPKRRLPSGFAPFGGHQFWCLPLHMARYVDEFVAAAPGFVRFFTHSFVPDETFFHTILLNSPFRDEIVDDDLHYLDRRTGDAHPRTLGSGDLEVLRASTAPFARKFDTTFDTDVLDLVDLELLGARDIV